MAAFPQTTISQNPVDLGSGFEDPMDPCTMCQQGQMEIQNAYNELTQSCNACQTQHNLQQLQTQGGCQGCATAQKVIQNVQQQSTGCASCGTQPTQYSQLEMLPSGQPAQFANLPLSAGQPMLTPLTGTSNQQLLTVPMQPGMMANQLPIALERGPIMTPTALRQNIVQPSSTLMTTSTGGMQTTQPMVVGGTMMTPSPSTQPMVTGMTTQPAPMVMQPVVTPNIPPPPPPMMVMQPAPVNIIPAPPPPAPVQIPTQPMIQVPQYTPAQIAALQQYAASVQPHLGGLNIGVSGTGGFQAGVGGGSGKVPGATVGQDVNTVVLGGSGYGFGGVGIGGSIAGGPGAFDTHRPDLHAGGGWHNLLPRGAIENVFNLY